ncbi:MAG: HAD hydrolase-like protein [Candidatus Babeliales bacterium]|nr:HAD hydrolase-like protein [Candidatus Babeliales bacterium]
MPPIIPQNTIIAFDIHGVLFKPNFKKIIQLAWNHKKVFTIGFYLLNPKFTFKLISLKYKRAVPEEYFMTLTRDYPSLEQYKSLAIAISNAQTPVQELIDMAQNLKNQGYTLHIFSNIGQYIFADLAHTHPNVFTLFDAIHVPMEYTGYISKRHPDAFDYYLKQHNPENKMVILIDDNKHNIARASQVGIVGIYFKNSDQLRSELQQLHIL